MAINKEATPKRRWKMRAAIGLPLVICVTALVSFRHVIPSGIGGANALIPYLAASHDRGTFTSPGGTSSVEVVTNDGGAMQTEDKYASWGIVRRWSGKEVVARGYLRESYGPVPLKWLSETKFSITFVTDKDEYEYTDATVVVDLNDASTYWTGW